MATKLTDASSIEQILQEMTLAEKAKIVIGASPFRTVGLDKYDIPMTVWLDGGTGFNTLQYNGEEGFWKEAEKAEEAGAPLDPESFGGMGGLFLGLTNQDETEAQKKKELPELGCYPPGMFLGATWNPEPLNACGHSLGKEMNKLGVDVVLGTPNVNIHRDPLNGRLFEGYSEDPCLVSQLAPAFVRGVQEEGVVANVKHFAANNQETERMGVDEHIPERALREIYLPGFKACVDAGCQTVMSAYNKINGLPCAMNPWLLTEVLRKEWGFDGCVVSDWSAAYEQAAALEAGNDLIMPGPRGYRCIIEAVEKGRMAMDVLDNCIRNQLKIILQTPAINGRRKDFDLQEAVEAAEFAAKEGITLLQNDGTLPLGKTVKIAFYGKRSKDFAGSGAGSAQVDTVLMTTPYGAAAELLGADAVTFGEASADTNVWVVTVGANGQEGADRQHMDMDEDDKEVLEQAIAEASIANGKVILILNTCGPVSLMEYKDRVSAIVCAYYPGMRGGKVCIDILFGKVNPSGKLPLTWPKYYRDCPTYHNFPGENKEVWYGEGIYVGYRYYDTKKVEPLYPFGYGLSYTNFEICDIQAPESVNVEDDGVEVAVTVKNTGSMDGSEVVQLYIHDVVSRIEKPEKELKAFQKVFVKAGEERKITMILRKEDFASYCAEYGMWATEPGEYDLLVGNSSANIEVQKRITVNCINPFRLIGKTSVGEVVANERAVNLINEAISGNIMQVAGSAVVFFPAMSWQEVWGTFVTPYLQTGGLARHQIDKIYERLLEDLKKL